MVRRRITYVKKVLTVAGIIVLLQLAAMWKIRSDQPAVVSLKDYMTNLEGDDAEGNLEQRIYTKIQIALSDFRIKTGSYPESLEALVPDYFDAVPRDPATQEPFYYELYKDTFKLGAKGGAKKPGAKPGMPGLPQSALTVEVLPGSKEEQELLIASLSDTLSNTKIYDPTDKPDPFLVYDFSPKEVAEVGKSPLEQIPYSEMRLSAVLLGFEPKAIIEGPSGRGYTVSIGDKIGNTGGEIRKIEQNKVTVLETIIDFTGEKKTRLIELRIVQPKVEN